MAEIDELKRIREQVERIAKEAGAILLDHFERIETIDYKGRGNPVTEADRASERFIAGALSSLTPGVPVFGEEYGMQKAAFSGLRGDCWVVDPLDGTANYATRIPVFAVSIALMRDARPVVGITYDPTRDQLFSAAQGGDCLCNGERRRVNKRSLSDGLSPVGVSADIIRERRGFMSRLAKGRSLGAASIQIAYVAAGVFDAAMDVYTRLWDVAAGALLIETAGGRTTSWDGKPIFPLTSDAPYLGEAVPFVASNGVSHDAMVEWLKADE